MKPAAPARCPGCPWLLLLLLAGAGVRAQGPAWQQQLPLPGTCRISQAAPAPDSGVYLVVSYVDTLQLGGQVLVGDTSGYPVGSGADNLAVACWSLAGRRFDWVLPLAGQYEPGSLIVQDSALYLLAEVQYRSGRVGPVPLLPGCHSFVAKLLDRGTHAAVGWVWQLPATGPFVRLDALAVRGSDVWVAGTRWRGGPVLGTPALRSRRAALLVARLTEQAGGLHLRWGQSAPDLKRLARIPYPTPRFWNGHRAPRVVELIVTAGRVCVTGWVDAGGTLQAGSQLLQKDFAACLADADTQAGWVWP